MNLAPLTRSMHPLMQQLRAAALHPDERQERLAERAGYTCAAVSEWLSGRRTPYLSSFTDLAAALGYDVVLVKREQRKSA